MIHRAPPGQRCRRVARRSPAVHTPEEKMQRTEAAAILGVEENATAAQARDRARQLESELSQKIGRAPTPSLRGSYQRSLQQVAEAARAFTGEGGDAGGAD